MPPKKVDKGQQKAAEKAKQKVVEDKTFGLKNKNKSKAVQKYIRSVQQQVTGGRMKTQEEIAAEQHAQKEAKKAALRQQALLASLYKGTENIKKLTVDPNAKKTDPRSIREEQAIDLYTDQRDQQKKSNEETIDDWDQAKLELVVKTKHGAHKATTDIVCKYFLDALEKRLYGWFWVCPNGDACQYKHCLPPGYVLKKKEKTEDVDDDEEPIEEIIERERAALPAGGTPVTLETFLAWKERKAREAKEEAEEAKRKAAEAKGQKGPGMSGRDLFAFNPSLFVDDAQAIDENDYAEDEEYWNQQLAEEAAAVEADAERRRQEALEARDQGGAQDNDDISPSSAGAAAATTTQQQPTDQATNSTTKGEVDAEQPEEKN